MDLSKLQAIKRQREQALLFPQAEHNWHLAQKLFADSGGATASQDKYYDWVDTTGFYAALHYVKAAISFDNSCIFYGYPMDGFSFDEIVNFARDIKSAPKLPKNAAQSRHEILKKIVQDTYSKISNDYNKLYDSANTSRYKLYFRNLNVESSAKTLGRVTVIREWFRTTYATFITPVTPPSEGR